MSVCRKLPDGTVQKIAGHTILLDANAQEIRQGDFSVSATDPTLGDWHRCTITFTDPMPDNDYIVVITGNGSASEADVRTQWHVFNKTTTGFECSYWSQASTPISYHYYAWKPVKIEGYTELQNKINNPDETPTIDSMNLVTSDGVARAIENASAVWKGTKAEWNALPAADKVKYDLAVLLDKTLVKAVDRETGDETDVADLSGQFVGTHAEWEAESNKTQYKTALLTDERTTVNEVTSTGALNEVADNAKIWRGTKEEWDELSAAEKDKWDQAEIETIEAQGLNPFRTLSDPETLSIALNTDYTCPHDGFIVVKGARNSNFTIIINGVTFFDTYTVENDENGILVPVQQGDVMRITAESTPQVRARWYTTDINPGNPIDYPVIHRSQALDWDNRIVVTGNELYAGYTCPADGYFICGNIPTIGNVAKFTVNGHFISYSDYWAAGSWSAFGVQIPVQKGDVCKSDTPLFTGWDPAEPNVFVPYKDYPDYSTTEHWTGKRWIDGKKIYSRVVELPSPVTIYSNWTNIPVGIANINEIITSHVRFSEGGPMTSAVALPIASSTNVRMAVYGIDHGNIDMVVLEYTKTTDD